MATSQSAMEGSNPIQHPAFAVERYSVSLRPELGQLVTVKTSQVHGLDGPGQPMTIST